MGQNATFRCPFEIKGKAEGKILSFTLSDSQHERLETYKRALAQFYIDTSLIGLRFVFPQELFDSCSSFEKLREAILPYECELIAAEIDYRLYPCLIYQPWRSLPKDELHQKKLLYLFAASALVDSMKEMGYEPPSSVSGIANWISSMTRKALRSGIKSPQLLIRDSKKFPLPLLRTVPGSLVIDFERIGDLAKNVEVNRNLFALVKCPLYPKEFGRYSETVEIVLSREAHFLAVNPKLRRRIRHDSNLVLRNGGVPIKDLKEDKQNTGLWLPSDVDSTDVQFPN